MPKVIIIHENGDIGLPPDLTDHERMCLGEKLFAQLETDNHGQFILYTGIQDPDHVGEEDVTDDD